MSPAQLLAHFDRVCEAPGAVPRLRRFILDLAVRGKLVEQDPNDEPAAELLKKIELEKRRLETDGKITSCKLPARAVARGLSIALRPGWQHAAIANILVELQTGPFGSSLHQSDYRTNGVPVVNPASIKAERIVPIDSMAVGTDTLERLAAFKLRVGDIVMGRRGEMGRSALVSKHEDGWLCGTGTLVLRPSRWICGRFLVMLIGSPPVRDYLSGSAVGTTMQNLNQTILLGLIVAVPPLAEQDRIVAKVDELMALCDRLEAAQAERERRRDRLVAASLKRLNAPATASESREHVRFHLNHLPRLTTRREHVRETRQTIRSLAMRGHLVPHHTDDEPASDLIKRIRVNKNESRVSGVRGASPTQPIDFNEIPFELPANWSWVRFGELIAHSDAGWSPKTEDFPKSGAHWGVLKVSAVTWEEFRPYENKQLLPGVKPRTTAQVHAGDFLISRANTSELIARAVVVDHEPNSLLLSDKIVRLHITSECNHRYLWMVNNHAVHARSYYAREASGTSLSMKNVSRAVIYSLAIPLPPLAEQHRIVAKVDELMAVCDKLEAQLNVTETESTRLLEATLHQALAVA